MCPEPHTHAHLPTLHTQTRKGYVEIRGHTNKKQRDDTRLSPESRALVGSLEEQITALREQIAPLDEELHAILRREGAEFVVSSGALWRFPLDSIKELGKTMVRKWHTHF